MRSMSEQSGRIGSGWRIALAVGVGWLPCLAGAADSSTVASNFGKLPAAADWTILIAGLASLASVLAASLALALGLHERAYRRLCMLILGVTAFMAAAGELGGWGAASWLLGWAFGVAGAALMFSSTVISADAGAHRFAPWLDRAGWLLAVLMLAVWMVPGKTLMPMAGSIAALAIAALACSIPLALRFALEGSRLAWGLAVLAALLTWSVVGVLGGLVGWWSGDDAMVQWAPGFGALSVLGLFIALSGRLVTLRQQHESTRAQHAESSASLAAAKHREQFARALKDIGKRSKLEADLEWQALRLLAQSAGERVTAEVVSVGVKGYRDFDYALTEPMSAKDALEALLSARAATLQGVCRSRRPVQLPLTLDEKADASTAPHYAVVPLGVPRPGWGALIVQRASGQLFSQDELEELADLADLAMDAIEEGAEKVALKREAELDALTGVVSKRAGSARLDSLVRAAASSKSALSVMFVDLDHFKPVNEKQGTAVGDACLREIADVIRTHLGDEGSAYREGGDEFVVLLPGSDLERAKAVAENIRAEVAALRVPAGTGTVKVTVSIGVSDVVPSDEVGKRVLDRARLASDAAKGAGRNRVHVKAAAPTQESGAKPLIL